MNAQFRLTASGVEPLRILPHLPSTGAPTTRVSVFGSFMGGYNVLRELLLGLLACRVDVVGVASDVPTEAFTHPSVRLWNYADERDDEVLVPQFAREHGLPVFTGRVRTPEFYKLFME